MAVGRGLDGLHERAMVDPHLVLRLQSLTDEKIQTLQELPLGGGTNLVYESGGVDAFLLSHVRMIEARKRRGKHLAMTGDGSTTRQHQKWLLLASP